MTAGEVEVFFIAVGGTQAPASAASAAAASTCESSFRRTFRRCQEADLAPRLIDVSAIRADGRSDSAILEPPLKDNAVYVFNSFEGETFEQLQARRCRVYGAPCVERCLDSGESLPKVGHPVYSFAMRGAVVCCTNVPADQRTQLYRLVQYMGGEVSRDFTEVVTHLITLTVGSKKYEVAAERRLPVLLPDWVLATWKRCSCCDEEGGGDTNEAINALESVYMAQFACPVFKGLVITASALPNRKDVRDLIERHGGIFTGEMRSGECTHLVINEPTGKKYEHAVRWNIAVVRPQWLLDCVQAGYHVAERPYGFDGRGHYASSTPNSSAADSSTDVLAASRRPMPALLDVSAIGASASMARANVTVQSCDGNATAQIPAVSDPLDDIKPAAGGHGFFLDGCRVYLHGFATPRLDKVRKLIDSSGAARVATITQKPTHVLAADCAGAVVDAPGLAAMLHLVSPMPHIVTVTWLIECFKQQRLLDAVPFAACLSLGSAGPSRPPCSSQLPFTPVKDKIKEQQSVNAETTGAQGDLQRRPLAVCNDANTGAFGNAPETGAPVAKRLSSAIGKSWSEKDRDIVSQYMDDWTGGDSSFAELAAAAKDGAVAVQAATTGDAAAGELAAATTFSSRQERAADVQQATVDSAETGFVTGASTARSVGRTSVPVAAGVPEEGAATSTDGCGPAPPLGDSVHVDADGGKCLQGKRFAFRGFGDDDTALLQSLVAERGGTVVSVGDRGDYLVEPLEGFAERSGDRSRPIVSGFERVVTATWLQACLEAGRVLPVDDCPLFQPLVLPDCNGSSPLAGCVVSVSGFVGAVREAVYHVVQLAGGQPQETLAKRTTGTVQATTHLLLAEPTGRKYEAAQNWGIPTLTLAWLLDSTRLGVRQSELLYRSADVPSSAAAKSFSHTLNNSAATNEAAAAGNLVDARRSLSGAGDACPEREAASLSTAALAVTGNNRDRTVIRPSTAAADATRLTPVPAADVDAPAVRSATDAAVVTSCTTLVRPAAAVVDGSRTSCMPPSGSGTGSCGGNADPTRQEAPATAATTPAVPAGSRLPGLVSSRDETTPMTKSHKLGIDTPSKWLNPDVVFHPGFDLSCVGGDYATAHAAGASVRSPRRRSSLPMEELLNKHLQMALEAQQPSEPPMLRPPVTPRGGAAPRVATIGAQSRRSRHRQQQQLPMEVTAWTADHIGSTGRDSLVVNAAVEGAAPGVNAGGSPAVVRRSARLHGDGGAAFTEETSAGAPSVGGVSRQQQLKQSDPPADDDGCQGVARAAALCDQLQSFMSTTRKTRAERRRSRKRAASAVDDEDVGAVLSAKSDRGSVAGGSGSSGGGRANAATAGAAGSAADSAPDPSQRVQVMWDDAVSREEARKLAEHLDRASCPIDDDQGAAAFAQRLRGSLHHVPGDLGNENRSDSNSPSRAATADAGPSSGPAFLLSGLTPEERDAFASVVRSLGGTLLDAPAFDDRCTHLVVSKPSRNEKFLACVATGKWILHPSYFDACRRASHFVAEEPYEWGGADMAAVCRPLGDATVKLAAAARRWRLQAAIGTSSIDGQKRGSSLRGGLSECRAFADWHAIVCTEEAKEGGFRRLLEAGGATVAATKPPFDGLCAMGVTHAFVDLRRTKYAAADFYPLLSRGIRCLKPDYIAAYLTDEAPPNVGDFQVAELRLPGADDSTLGEKRRLLTTANNSSPRKRPR